MNGLKTTTRNVLLGCGIAASALYVATDIIGAIRYPGYRYAEQQFSELTAAGSPVRPLMLAVNIIPYTLLMAAFAAGVWAAAGPRRTGRITAALLAAYTATGTATVLFFPMDTREVLAAGLAGSQNALHAPGTLVMDLFLVAGMGVGATLLGRWFRWYSYGTILLLLAAGGLVSTQISRMEANLPTPWMGLEERVNIYATMVWVTALAVGLWRAREVATPRRPSQPLGALRGAQEIPR